MSEAKSPRSVSHAAPEAFNNPPRFGKVSSYLSEENVEAHHGGTEDSEVARRISNLKFEILEASVPPQCSPRLRGELNLINAQA
jgi:hypothetical protein